MRRCVRDFTGCRREISAKSGTSVCRSVGVVGRNFLSAMVRPLDLLEQLDLLIGLERHDRLLPVAPLAHEAPLTANLPQHLLRAYRSNLHVEDRLDGAFDVDLVGLAPNFEQVL